MDRTWTDHAADRTKTIAVLTQLLCLHGDRFAERPLGQSEQGVPEQSEQNHMGQLTQGRLPEIPLLKPATGHTHRRDVDAVLLHPSWIVHCHV